VRVAQPLFTPLAVEPLRVVESQPCLQGER
jgi:hypothetical protein